MTDKPDAKTVLTPKMFRAAIAVGWTVPTRDDLYNYADAWERAEARVEALERVLTDIASGEMGINVSIKAAKSALAAAATPQPRPPEPQVLTRSWPAAPNAPSDAPDATSPRQGLEDDSSLEHDCLAGTGWAKEETADGSS